MNHSATCQVLTVGLAYRDLVMTGMRDLPRLGEETYATALYETWGGVATMARVCRALGMTTALCTAVGEDEASDRLLRDMSAAGIDTALSVRHTGWALPVTVALSLPTDRAMVTVEQPPPDSVAAHLEQERLQADAIVVDMRDPATGWLRRARSQGSRVYASRGFDPTGQWGHAELAAAETCDVLMLNELEARAFTGTDDPIAAARRLAERVPTVVVTLGERGMVGVDAGSGEEAVVPAFPIEPWNTTGAGDSALAALVYASQRPGRTLADRLEIASFIAGAILERPGGAAEPPTLAELRARSYQRSDRRVSRVQELLAAAPG